MIAVIMSLYKNDKLEYVRLAVNSILVQTYSDFTFFIIYDGPIDNDVNQYMQTVSDPRIIIFKRNQNKGLACSLNELLAIVLQKDYQYIARMDSDDVSSPNRFERQIDFLNKNSECECLGCWAIEIDSEGKEYFKKQMPVTHDECLELFKKRDCMIHPTVMFRRSYFEKAGLYPEDTFFAEDTMMWARGFVAGCHFANLPEYLYEFRIDANFFNRRRGWKYAKEVFLLRKRVNSMLGWGLKENCYGVLYALVKMMPTPVLNILYKTLR